MYTSPTLCIPSWAWLTYSKYCLISTFKLCQHGAVQDSLSISLCEDVTMLYVGKLEP